MKDEQQQRFRWEWPACAGLTLALVALWLWVGAGAGGRVLLACLASAALAGAGLWMGRRPGAVQTYAHLLIGGGVAAFFGSICAGYSQQPPGVFHAWWLAWLLLAIGACALVFFSGAAFSRWIGLPGLALALLGVTLQQFTFFSLAANLLLLAVAVHFVRGYRWTAAAWIALLGLHLGFLLGWSFSDGRVDPDRYLELSEYWWTLAFFATAWAVFVRIAVHSPDDAFTPPRRLLFATLNNALFYFLGVLILPPHYPNWYWKFTLAAGCLFLVAWTLTVRHSPLRRAFAIHGTLLVALGIASSVIGPHPAAMLAVVSAFFALAVQFPGQSLLRYCAGLAALLAVGVAVVPIYGSAALRDVANPIVGVLEIEWQPRFGNYQPSLWLGVFVGAPLVFSSIWISRRRKLWRPWAVLFFGALGLGTWLLTTLAQVPARLYPPILAIEAVLVTATILVLAIGEYPCLASSVLLLAQLLWFQQVGRFNVRPWWNPFIVVVCTLGLSWWWQTRGRVLVSERALRWGQGIAAAVAVAILMFSIESAFGRSATALVVLSLVAVALIAYASFVSDWLLFGFAQLLVATVVGEFIGQLSYAPLPTAMAPLFPIVALLIAAPMVASPFPGTLWERPARWVALLYRALAAAMFVVWTLHYVGAGTRFLTLALAAFAVLWYYLKAQTDPLSPSGMKNGAGAPPAGEWHRYPAGASGRGTPDDDPTSEAPAPLPLLHAGASPPLSIFRFERAPDSLVASLICAVGALLAFWMGWAGVHGFRLRDFFAFLLLLCFGQLLRYWKLLADELQTIGTILGLAAVTQWIANWTYYYYHPSYPMLPVSVVWAAVATLIICVSWWLKEWRYRAFGWALLVVALGQVLWIGLAGSSLSPGHDRAFQFGLLAVGIAALAAALTYARRSSSAPK